VGSLYRKRRKQRDGTTVEEQIWWVKYYKDGRPVRESTGTTKEKEAANFLKRREGDVAKGHPILPRAEKVRWEEAAADLRQHYEATGARDLVEYDRRVAHLTRVFAGRRIAGIDQVGVNTYTLKRREDGVVDSTIRRELGTLITLLRRAYRNGELLQLPLFDRPKGGKPREGFFERAPFDAVRRKLTNEDLRVAVTVAYTFGWRMQSEVLTLERRQLDLDAGTLRLGADTKTDDGRVIYLTPECARLLAAQVARVEALQRRLGRVIPFLFPHHGKGPRAGTRRKDFRKAWTTACTAAGVPRMIRHDFRRTAVRNMVNAGVPERVAMTITGHKTRYIFDAYHIVSPGDLQDAARKLAGTIPGTIAVSVIDAGPQVRETPRTGG
jgi:integrase